jgi:hypothetical protein
VQKSYFRRKCNEKTNWGCSLSALPDFADGTGFCKPASKRQYCARVVITFIPIFMYFVLELYKQCILSKLIMKIAVHYIFSLGAAFLTVFLLGFGYMLPKNAYRDIFINFSIVYLIVAIVFIIVLVNHEKNRKGNSN